MTDSFTLVSVQGGNSLEFKGAIVRSTNSWEEVTYVATLVGGSLSATVRVTDAHADSWSVFFRDLAKHWRGWDGPKTQASLEENLRLSCTIDRLGHVSVHVILQGEAYAPRWRAEDVIHLEAGQLDEIARSAEAYFG
jgi:hypothetical protein